jgi:hypothetical protein
MRKPPLFAVNVRYAPKHSNAAAAIGPIPPNSEKSPRNANDPTIAAAASNPIHALIFAISFPSPRAR